MKYLLSLYLRFRVVCQHEKCGRANNRHGIQIIATGSSDRTIKIWNLQSGKLLRTIRGHTSSVIDIVINSDEQTLASASYDTSIKVWNMHTGALLQTLVGHSDSVFRITFSADGQLLASGSKDTTIKIWRRNRPIS